MLSSLLLALSLATAAEPLVHTGPASDAIDRVSADGELETWELKPVLLPSLLPRSGAMALGANQPTPCPNPSLTNSELRNTVGLAEKQVLYHQEWEAARLGLELAAQALSCLTEPIEASLASRIFFLRAFVEVKTEHPEAAAEAYGRAVQFVPKLEWDERFPPKGVELLAQAIEANESASTVPLTLGPGLQRAENFWVDGQPATPQNGALQLKPGLHLVQILQPQLVTLPILIDPESPTALTLAEDMARAPLDTLLGTPELQALLQQEFGTSSRTWVYAGHNTWKLQGEWSELPKSAAVLRNERAALGRKVGRAGVGILGVGLLGSAIGWTVVGTNFSADPTETRASYEARQARVDATAPWAYTASGIAVGGLAVTATGWIMVNSRVRLGLGSQGSPGVTVATTWPTPTR